MSVFDEIFEVYTNSLDEFKQLQNHTSVSHVYHYTSPNGLKSIIESKSIFASDYRFLNDPTEFQHFIDIVLDQLDQNSTYKNNYFYKIIKSHFNNNFIDQFKIPIAYYDNDLNKARIDEVVICNFYIFSTSSECDALSMWNYYSKVPNNEGYNLKFDLSNLLKEIQTTINHFDNDYISKNGKINNSTINKRDIYCVKVNYCIDTQRKIAVKILNDFYKLSQKISKEEEFIEQALQFLERLVLLYAYCQKSEAFYTENEYRIIIALPRSISSYKTENVKIEFPIINGCFAPKLKITLNSLEKLVKQITTSPKNSTNFAKTGLRTFLDYNDLKDVGITPSNIKVRF